MKNKTFKGFLMAILAATFWGTSGTMAQFLIQEKELQIEWLITMRLLVSGFCLLIFAKYVEKDDITKIWTNQKDRFSLIFFSIAGMTAVQYTYFAAIKHSNAATATVLQYCAPVMIAIYLAIKTRKAPQAAEIVAIVLALLGTFLLVTHGNINNLAISPLALFLGLTAALTLAIYTVQPKRLLEKYHASTVIGWAMLFGGIIFSFISPPWEISGQWDLDTFLYVGFIILFATLIAFYFYLSATKIIGAQKTSLLASVEPLVAVFLSVLWLDTPFISLDWIGTLCILTTILLLSRKN